jgi:DNA modification methylase
MTIQIINGDCLEVMKELSDNSIDFILTDLPYGTTACKWDNIIPYVPMWEQIKRIRKDNTAIALFGTEPFSSHLRLSNLDEYKYDWIWEKNRPTGLLNSKHQPMRNTELISIFYKKNGKYYPIKEQRLNYNNKKMIYKNYSKGNKVYGKHTDTTKKIADQLRYPTTLKFFKTDENRKHPTQKPIALLEYLIKTYTKENETVLDFTMGSGSTGVACVNTNRNFIGIELDKEYFKISKERIENASN